MKTTILFALLLCAYSQISAEESFKFQRKNAVHFELGGHGFIYSLNVERMVLQKPNFKLSLQAGMACYPFQDRIINIWMPLMCNQIYSLGNHHLESGFGIVPVAEPLPRVNTFENTALSGVFGAFRLGYRYQKANHPLVFRTAITPFIEVQLPDRGSPRRSPQVSMYPMASMSIGWAFSIIK